MEKYDLCVIGGGPAGYAAAMRAIDFGKKVILIEKEKLGGAGIYNGALASKVIGAGGGGFILFFVPSNEREKFIKKFKKFTIIPFNFENNGSQIIMNTNNKT